jgi:hypothetical protein
MLARPRSPERSRERSAKGEGERLYFGRQGLRLAGAIFVLFGVVILVQIGRYLDHDVERLQAQTKKSG